MLAAAYPPAPVPAEKPLGAAPTFLVAKVEGDKLLSSARSPRPGMKSALKRFNKRRESHAGRQGSGSGHRDGNRAARPQNGESDRCRQQALDAKALTERSRSRRRCWFPSDGQPISEGYRKLLKDDVILLILPEAQVAPEKIRPPEKLPRPPEKIPGQPRKKRFVRCHLWRSPL